MRPSKRKTIERQARRALIRASSLSQMAMPDKPSEGPRSGVEALMIGRDPLVATDAAEPVVQNRSVTRSNTGS